MAYSMEYTGGKRPYYGSGKSVVKQPRRYETSDDECEYNSDRNEGRWSLPEIREVPPLSSLRYARRVTWGDQGGSSSQLESFYSIPNRHECSYDHTSEEGSDCEKTERDYGEEGEDDEDDEDDDKYDESHSSKANKADLAYHVSQLMQCTGPRRQPLGYNYGESEDESMLQSDDENDEWQDWSVLLFGNGSDDGLTPIEVAPINVPNVPLPIRSSSSRQPFWTSMCNDDINSIIFGYVPSVYHRHLRRVCKEFSNNQVLTRSRLRLVLNERPGEFPHAKDGSVGLITARASITVHFGFASEDLCRAPRIEDVLALTGAMPIQFSLVDADTYKMINGVQFTTMRGRDRCDIDNYVLGPRTSALYQKITFKITTCTRQISSHRDYAVRLCIQAKRPDLHGIQTLRAFSSPFRVTKGNVNRTRYDKGSPPALSMVW